VSQNKDQTKTTPKFLKTIPSKSTVKWHFQGQVWVEAAGIEPAYYVR